MARTSILIDFWAKYDDYFVWAYKVLLKHHFAAILPSGLVHMWHHFEDYREI